MDEKILRDKIYACWLGKNIGGTLGGPIEGRTDFMDIKWFPSLGENGALPNDDLDLQLLNLHALEHFGASLRAEQLGREWVEHNYFPVDEYGYAATNLRRGLRLPLAGCYNNRFTNCMGSPIRSEIWAAVCAGRPKLAAFYAWQDAVVDHAGGEGIYGEIFNAVAESVAYTSSDIFYIIDEALRYIPASSRVYRAVTDTVKWYKEGVSYTELRPKLLEKYGSHPLHFTDAPQNIAIMLVGFLYADNFEDGLLKVANYGYDADCTVATFASLFGIMYGTAAIPEKWSSPVGDRIELSKEVRGFRCPATLGELTDRTLRMYRILLEEDENNYNITEEDYSDYAVQNYTLPEGELREEAFCITLKYDGEPVITPLKNRKMTFRIRNNTYAPWHVKLSVDTPDGIECSDTADITLNRGEEYSFGADVISVKDFHSSQINCTLNVDRMNEEGLWKRYFVPFVLIRSTQWIIDGCPADLETNIVTFEPNSTGKHTAITTVYSADTRPSRFYIPTEEKMKCTLDGKAVLDAEPQPTIRTSYSTICPPSQEAEFVLAKGKHSVVIEIECPPEKKAELAFIPTAKKESENPTGRPLVAYEQLENIIG